MAIFVNTRIRLSGTFKDTAGALLDPVSVQFTLTTPPLYNAPSKRVYAYGTDPQVVRDSVGQYHFDLLVNFSGQAFFRWASLAPGQESADEGSFVVQKSTV